MDQRMDQWTKWMTLFYLSLATSRKKLSAFFSSGRLSLNLSGE